MNVLFICSRNRLRSPTAEIVARNLGYEADSAGLASDAEHILDEDQIRWSDVICVMETSHKLKLNKKYAHLLKNKNIIILNIQDKYDFMQEELVNLLQNRLPVLLEKKSTKSKKKLH